MHVLKSAKPRAKDVAQAKSAQTCGAQEPEGDVTPSLRLLAAVEVIGKKGPLTYKELELSLGMSRAATWRVVAVLKDAGWVHIRMGGRMIELDPRLDALLASAHFGDPEFNWLSKDLRKLSQDLSVHIDAFILRREGTVELHETSRRLTALASPPDGPDDLLMLAIRAAMSPNQLERHLASLQASAHSADRDVAAQFHIRREIQDFAGYAWSNRGRVLVVSVRGKLGSPAAIRFCGLTSAPNPNVLRKAFQAILPWAAGEVESIAHGIQKIPMPELKDVGRQHR